MANEVAGQDVPGSGLNAGKALHSNDLATGLAAGKGPQQRQQRLQARARPYLLESHEKEYKTLSVLEDPEDNRQLEPTVIRL